MVKLTKANYVDEAEKVVKNLRERGHGKIKLTTSKIRNLLSMVSTIYNEVIHYEGEQLNDDLVERIQYLKMRFAYEAGRERSVKEFVEIASIFDILSGVGRDKEKCILFCKYMEGIVAYHKYYGGRDR